MHIIEHRKTDADIKRLKAQGYSGPLKAGDWSVAHAFRYLPKAKIKLHEMQHRGQEVRLIST